MKKRLARRQIWGAPVGLGLITATGLIAALLSDGMGDAFSWGALAVPIVVVVWFSLSRGY